MGIYKKNIRKNIDEKISGFMNRFGMHYLMHEFDYKMRKIFDDMKNNQCLNGIGFAFVIDFNQTTIEAAADALKTMSEHFIQLISFAASKKANSIPVGYFAAYEILYKDLITIEKAFKQEIGMTMKEYLQKMKNNDLENNYAWISEEQ